MTKSVYSRWLYHLNFILTMAADSKMDWDYSFFYLMIIDAFYEMLSHFNVTKEGFLTRSWFTLLYY